MRHCGIFSLRPNNSKREAYVFGWSICPSVSPSVRWLTTISRDAITGHTWWTDYNETWHKRSSCSRAPLERFSISEVTVKGQGHSDVASKLTCLVILAPFTSVKTYLLTFFSRLLTKYDWQKRYLCWPSKQRLMFTCPVGSSTNAPRGTSEVCSSIAAIVAVSRSSSFTFSSSSSASHC